MTNISAKRAVALCALFHSVTLTGFPCEDDTLCAQHLCTYVDPASPQFRSICHQKTPRSNTTPHPLENPRMKTFTTHKKKKKSNSASRTVCHSCRCLTSSFFPHSYTSFRSSHNNNNKNNLNDTAFGTAPRCIRTSFFFFSFS